MLVLSGVAQLMVRAVGSDAAFADPSNIVVGFASDLILQVECLSENGTGDEVITWSRNRTTVTSGLQAFGVSQEAGMLRVHPVRELDTGGNEFVCSDGTRQLEVMFSLSEFSWSVVGGCSFLVGRFIINDHCHFVPVDDLFFTGPIPDIPEATLKPIQENGSLYFTVDSERGVYRSASNITSKTCHIACHMIVHMET